MGEAVTVCATGFVGFSGVREPTLNNRRHRGRLRRSTDLPLVLDGSVGRTVAVGRVGTLAVLMGGRFGGDGCCGAS